MKGVATTAGTVMVIIIFLTFFGIYLYMVDNVVQSNAKLNLESLEALRLKSTFGLFNRSLGMTWFISTVQTIFATADEAVGCGYDDGRITQGYWYNGYSDKKRDFAYDGQGNPKKRIPDEPDKYNAFGMNPQICYPRDNHIINYIKEKLVIGKYLDLKNPVDASGVSIDRKEPTYDIILNDKNIDSLFTQRIVAKTTSGTIDAKTTNNNTIETSLKIMAASGRKAVENFLIVGDNFYSINDPVLNYQPNGTTPSMTMYKDRIAAVVKGVVADANGPYQNDITAITNVKTVYLAASDDSTLQIVPSGQGLVVNYTAFIRYVEKNSSAPTIQLQWPTDSKKLSSCYGYRTDPLSQDIGKFHGGLDVAPTIDGVSEPVKSVADGKVIDLNKNCPNTCGSYGNFVLIKHENVYSFYAHLSAVSVAVGDTVSAGQQVGVMGSTGKSTGVHLHLEIMKNGTAATRSDPCNYIACEESTGKVCIAIPDTERGNYYYNDEESNTFEKRPVVLDIGVTDSLPALNCINWANITGVPHVEFSLNRQKDLSCCGGYMFVCGVTPDELPGLSTEQSLQIGDQTSNIIFPQDICNGVLLGGVLSCTNTGFVLVAAP